MNQMNLFDIMPGDSGLQQTNQLQVVKAQFIEASSFTWQELFEGYDELYAMKIEFDADNKLLGKVLYALAHCPVRPEFRINYTINDPEAAKNELLGKAVTDSKIKAKVLTEAVGVEIGEVITIDYSWGEVDFVINPMNKLMESCTSYNCEDASSYDIDIEPDNVDVSDTVTVVWSIR